MAKKFKLYRVTHDSPNHLTVPKKVEILVIDQSKRQAKGAVQDEYGNGNITAKRVKMKRSATFVISGPILMETANEQN